MSTPPDTSPAVAAALVALRELMLASDHYRLVGATHLGLSVNDSQAISYLTARGSLGQTELADALGFTTSSTTTLVDRLERRGLARRRPDPVDRRRTIVTLSAQAVTEMAAIRIGMGTVFDTVTPGQLPSVTAALHDLAGGLRRYTQEISSRSSPHTPPARRV